MAEELPNMPSYTPDYSGAPEMPEYQGLDLDKYKVSFDGGAALDTAGYDALKGVATRDVETDPNSVWGGMMLDKQATEELGQRDRAAAEAAGATAMARSNLAQRGGLTGGAAERLGAGGVKEQMMRNQEIARGGTQARQDINISDEDKRQAAIRDLQGQANAIKGLSLSEGQAKMAADQANATLAAGEAKNKSQWDLGAYGEANKKWYGEQMGEAQKYADEYMKNYKTPDQQKEAEKAAQAPAGTNSNPSGIKNMSGGQPETEK